MGFDFTTEQVKAIAPDTASLANARKLSNRKHWANLGHNELALWGECQGSALYQVKVELSTLTAQCSCPSRKQPCKHCLGLLLLVSTMGEEITSGDPPDWVTAWLEKRAASLQRKESKQTKEHTAPSEKTVARRQKLVEQGLARLDLWLSDLVRTGLASAETHPDAYWSDMAKQMVDNQLSGVATRIRRLGESIHASPDWTKKLLVQSGQLALLSQAYRNIDTLQSNLQDEVRTQLGWALTEDEVLTRGEHVRDTWLFLGSTLEETDKGTTQRTWLYGEGSKRTAMLMQFAPRVNPAFARVYPFGMRQAAELAYWPGAAPSRALIVEQQGELRPFERTLPGEETIDAFLNQVALTLARHPWQDTFLCVLREVIPVLDQNRWLLCDSAGQALPLAKGEHWRLLALSGGHTGHFAGIWNGEVLIPLGILAEGRYYSLSEGR